MSRPRQKVSTRRDCIAAFLDVTGAGCAVVAVSLLFWGSCRDAAFESVAPAAVEVAGQAGVDARPFVEGLRPKPATAVLLVRSKPPGATVMIEGVDRGMTPALVAIECTRPSWPVEVHKSGFQAWRTEVSCEAGGQQTLEAHLQRSSPAGSPVRKKKRF